jgi:hypothetical protein
MGLLNMRHGLNHPCHYHHFKIFMGFDLDTNLIQFVTPLNWTWKTFMEPLNGPIDIQR